MPLEIVDQVKYDLFRRALAGAIEHGYAGDDAVEIATEASALAVLELIDAGVVK